MQMKRIVQSEVTRSGGLIGGVALEDANRSTRPANPIFRFVGMNHLGLSSRARVASAGWALKTRKNRYLGCSIEVHCADVRYDILYDIYVAAHKPGASNMHRR